MYFENLAALIAMEGHGAYVWSAYGITLTVLLGLVISPILRRRQLLKELKMQLRRQQVQGEANAPRS
jgi:heme exporter protein D